MENEWTKRLSPWDWELSIMVESLTGKPCELCNGGDRDAEENPAVGTPYYPINDDVNPVLAVQVERGNDAQLLSFVGNGQMLIEKRPGGKVVFQFLNASGTVYADAPEHSYVVYRAPGRFEIVDRERFEKEHKRV